MEGDLAIDGRPIDSGTGIKALYHSFASAIYPKPGRGQTVAGRHHILLIGIDAYDGGGMLNGCVNDIDAVQRLLIDAVGVPRDCITRLASPRLGTVHETDVPEELPTLERLRAAFTRLGTDLVGPEDHVFVYYSGHGTQCLVANPHGRRFSCEALLPKDKVKGDERQFLFDWELNVLLARIAELAGAVTVVLDCCSSGGATRDIADEVPGRERFFRTEEEHVLALYEQAPERRRPWADSRCRPGETLSTDRGVPGRRARP